jgi:hypothetical protein
MTGFDADDETRRLLHAADPARSLSPVDADALAQILEETMSQPSTEPSTDDPRRVKARRFLIGGVAAAAIIGAVGIGFALTNDDSTTPSADTPIVEQPTYTKLSFGPPIGAKCMAPTAAGVASQDTAFEGKVMSAGSDDVTLEVLHFYKGTPSDLATVTKPDLGMTELPVDFQVGKTYFVGASDGQVSICGLAGLATDDLRALYEKAFPK